MTTQGQGWKIQCRGVGGWYDLKASEPDGSYRTEVFDTEQDARHEVRWCGTVLHGSRVVPLNTPADFDPYA